jgi:hypothetical protein
MSADVSDYLRRSASLLQAADRFGDSIDRGDGQEDAASDLLDRAGVDSFDRLRLGFEAKPGVQPSAEMSEGLSAILFDLQSANLLVAAGLRAGQRDAAAGKVFERARDEIDATRGELEVVPRAVGFEDKLNVQSATLASAVGDFRNYSNRLLGEIVGDVEKTMTDAASEVKKLIPDDIGKMLGQLGEAVPIIAKAGNLVRQGLEKLKRALEALTEMFGKESLKSIKDQIGELLKATGVSIRTLLQSILGADRVKERIERILQIATLDMSKVDAASNRLPEVARSFSRDNKILNALLRGIRLTAAILALVQYAAGWLLPTLAGAYLSIIGAALLVGRQYTGASRTLIWTDGLEQVAEGIR